MTPLLDTLMPMHLQIDHKGRITHAGPTLAKLRPDRDLRGVCLFDLFEVLRPRAIDRVSALRAQAGGKLQLRFAQPPKTALNGVLAPLGAASVLNLSFRMPVQDGVSDYALSAKDFAATDLTVDMLYLIEAKTAAMDASQRLNSRLQGAKIAAEERAFTDTLTGLKNRRAMNNILPRLVENGIEFSLMHLDLDHFKAINDTMGHAAGDHVLQEVARIMAGLTREEDTAFRIGGDEFLLIFQGMTDRGKLQSVAGRLLSRLEQPIRFKGKPCHVSASIGIARSVDYGKPDPARMMADADAALYFSKRSGRARLHFHAAG
ncbi:GGDEF domain-containing protein [Thalassovita aquimarina]